MTRQVYRDKINGALATKRLLMPYSLHLQTY